MYQVNGRKFNTLKEAGEYHNDILNNNRKCWWKEGTPQYSEYIKKDPSYKHIDPTITKIE